MPKLFFEHGLDVAEGKDWSLAVVKEFKDFVGKNPDLVPTVISLFESLPKTSNSGEKAVKGDISLTFIALRERSTIYKLEVGEKNFFLKCDNGLDSGTAEVRSSAKAARIVVGIPGVRVTNFQLGYHDKKYDFFIAEWSDLQPIKNYLLDQSKVPDPDNGFRLQKLETRIGRLERILWKNNFVDAFRQNMFYDPATDEIVLFDFALIKDWSKSSPKVKGII